MKHAKKKTSRFLAVFLALAMVAVSLPQSALTVTAAEETKLLENEVEAAETAAETTAVAEETTVTSALEEETAVTSTVEKETAGDSTAEKETDEVSPAETESDKTAGTEENAEEKEATAESAADETAVQDSEETGSETEDTGSETETAGETDEIKALGENGENTVNTVEVTIEIPYIGGSDNRKNLLERFEYAVGEGEEKPEEFTTWEGSFDDLVDEGYYSLRIEIDVPENGTLYFRPVLKEKCELDRVYGNNKRIEPESDGSTYVLSEVSSSLKIQMYTVRFYDVVFDVEYAEVLTVDGNEMADNSARVNSARGRLEFQVKPAEGYIVRAVESNSAGSIEYGNSNQYIFHLGDETNVKDPITIYIVTEQMETYNVDFTYPDGAEFFVNGEKLEDSSIQVDEGSKIQFSVTMPEGKGAYASYTCDGMTSVLYPSWGDPDDFHYEFSFALDITGDTSIKIDEAVLCTVTFNVVSDNIYGFWTNFNDYIDITESEDGTARKYSVQILVQCFLNI